MSFDRKLLEYISQYAEYLKFVVYVNANKYDIIEIKDIAKILNNIPKGLTFDVGRCIRAEMTVLIDG